MGSKKRSSDSVEEIDNQKSNTSSDSKVSSEHLKKKIKKVKKNEGEIAKPDNNDSSSNGVKPMERKKKRKALDKEKHRDDNAEVRPKIPNFEVKEVESRTSNRLPEFHIGVFKDLGSADGSVREAAAERLVTELQAVQKAYDRLENKEDVDGGLKLEAEKDDGLNNCAASLRYAVRRLIRGVSSSRECARQGFALGLTMLVGAVPQIALHSLLKLIIDLLEVSSSMKGQEIKDCLLGRLFAYGSLARSGRLSQESKYINEFTGAVITLACKKRYLQEPAVVVILQLIEKLPVEVVLKEVLEAPGLHGWFEGATEAGNPDALLLSLKLREKLSDDNKSFGKLLPVPYTSTTMFSPEHLTLLSNCLKESTFCQPRVHGVWSVLVNILLPDVIPEVTDPSTGTSNSTKKHKKNRKSSSHDEDIQKNLQNFWDVIIEGSLLSSSHDRKHLVFDVILLVLSRLPISCIPIVLSYKIVQCLVDILSTKDSWLYKCAVHFLEKLSDWVTNDEGRRVAVTMSLQKHSNGKFDNITRTKTVKDFMSGFITESGCMLFIQNLIDMFLDVHPVSEEPSDQSQSQTTDDNSEIGSIEEKESTPTSDFLKSWVVDSIPSVLKHSKLDNEAKFRVQKEILKFLAVQGLFSSSLGTEVTSFELGEKFRWPKAATSSSLRRMCIEQLQLLLANAQKGEGNHAVASGLEANDLGSYFMRFLSVLRNIPSVSLFRSLSDDDEKAFKKLQSMETRLSREERNCGMSTDANRLHALRYLLIQLLLQILLRPGEFFEAASESIICCKKFFPSSDLLDSSGEEEDEAADGDEEAPELMDVFVDTLLSLLPQSSAPMRSAIEQVFKYYSDNVTDDGLLRMLKVIKKDLKPARRQETDTQDEDDDDDDLLDIEEAEEDLDEGDSAGKDGSQSEDSEGITDSAPGNDDSDSDSGMDDEAMFRMDSYLAQIFKEKRNQAGGGETAHSQLEHFKLRVLSLLEIYLHENQGKPQVLKVYSNLAQAFINPNTTEGSEQLGDRICKIMENKIFKAKQYPRQESVQLSLLEPLLEKNLKLASKPFKKKKSATITPSKKKQSASFQRYRKITNFAQNSTYYLLKVIDSRNFQESELENVYKILKGALTGYFDGKNSVLKLDFIKGILRRWLWIARELFGFLVEKCGGAKSKFRRVEGLDLVLEILKPYSSEGNVIGKKMVSENLDKICVLVKELVLNMPEKQAKRAEVRKFCAKLFAILTNVKMANRFVEGLDSEGCKACESQLGKAFLDLKTQQV